MGLSNQHKIDWFLAKFTQKVLTKSAVFYQLFFREASPENFCKILVKWANFSANLSLKILRNSTFFLQPIRSPDIILKKFWIWRLYWGSWKIGKRHWNSCEKSYNLRVSKKYKPCYCCFKSGIHIFLQPLPQTSSWGSVVLSWKQNCSSWPEGKVSPDIIS